MTIEKKSEICWQVAHILISTRLPLKFPKWRCNKYKGNLVWLFLHLNYRETEGYNLAYKEQKQQKQEILKAYTPVKCPSEWTCY